jgi:hypothetical protein
MFVDYARNWGTNGIEIDSNGLNYQGDDDESTVEYETDGTALHIVYSGATNGWIPTLDKAVADVPVVPSNDEGIFGFGFADGSDFGETNLVSNTGVVASDVAAVGTARHGPAACEYGGNKGIFGFGYIEGDASPFVNMSNKVSDAGVVASDTTGVGTARQYGAACEYGGDKGIFGFGEHSSMLSVTNLVSNTGVVADDQAATTGSARSAVAACEYGGDKGIFGFGWDGSYFDETNLVSNTGVVSTDVTGVGTDRRELAACGYGEGKGIFGYGYTGSDVGMTNLVSNTGVVASDVSVVGTARKAVMATQYGGDKGIFGFGRVGASYYSMSNLVSNTGVVASDQAATTGSDRGFGGACSFN